MAKEHKLISNEASINFKITAPMAHIIKRLRFPDTALAKKEGSQDNKVGSKISSTNRRTDSKKTIHHAPNNKIMKIIFDGEWSLNLLFIYGIFNECDKLAKFDRGVLDAIVINPDLIIVRLNSVFMNEFNELLNILAEYDPTLNEMKNGLLALKKEHANKLPRFIFHNVDCHPAFPSRSRDNKQHPQSYIAESFKELSFENRFPLLKDLYNKAIHREVGFFSLQEVNEDAAEYLENYFYEQHFICIKEHYNLDNGSFYFFVAYNPKMFAIQNQDRIPLTESGTFLKSEQRKKMPLNEKLKHNLGIEFERSAWKLEIEFNNEVIVLIVIHLGLPDEHRLLATKVLSEALKEEKRRLLIGGDANGFKWNSPLEAFLNLHSSPNELAYQDQIDVLKKAGFILLTDMHTFFAHVFDMPFRYLSAIKREELEQYKKAQDYPKIRQFFFDLLKERMPILFGPLDHVFVRGNIKRTQVQACTLFNGRMLTSKTTLAPDFLREYKEALVSSTESPPSPLIPSDHFALEVEMELPHSLSHRS
jgi:endonuclease/exonuclease/phosphatase family metal-dependent hydrolase